MSESIKNSRQVVRASEEVYVFMDDDSPGIGHENHGFKFADPVLSPKSSLSSPIVHQVISTTSNELALRLEVEALHRAQGDRAGGR